MSWRLSARWTSCSARLTDSYKLRDEAQATKNLCLYLAANEVRVMNRRFIFTAALLIVGIAGLGSSAVAQNRSGSYLSREGELTIRDKGRSQPLKFSFSVGNSRGTCTGEVEGNARWVSRGVAEFSDDSCKLKFVFTGTRVRVSEGPDCGYHGAACGFAGIYRRARGR